jgi:hypothetical protein
VSHDDRATVSYLASRPEVDASRIGCLGLSFGGMRTNWLFGTDPRVKAAVSVGWMCDWKHLHEKHVGWHSWSQYVPGLAEFLELSDVASIGLPGALMVQECSRDELFPLSGMQATCNRLTQILPKRANARSLRCGSTTIPINLLGRCRPMRLPGWGDG